MKLGPPPDQTHSVTSAVNCKQLQSDLGNVDEWKELIADAEEHLNDTLLRSVFKL